MPRQVTDKKQVMKKIPRKLSFCWKIGATAALWGILSFQSPYTAAAEGQLKVSLTEAGLTVEAHGVDTEQTLRAIGAQAGFTVVAKGAARQMLDVSLKDVPLEAALSQLLRGENYAVVYKTPKNKRSSGGAKIGKVVLLSPSTDGAVSVGVVTQGKGQDPSPVLPQTAKDRLRATEAQTAALVFSGGEWRSIAKGVAKDHEEPATVSDLLANQAIQTVVGNMQTEARSEDEASAAEDAPGAMSENTPPAPQLAEEEQMAVNEALLISTRAAQRNLATLVEGLATATDQLFDAQASQNRGANVSGK
jgi:hypothetical protein